MKQLILVFTMALFCLPAIAQEEGDSGGSAMASLADIMNVAPKAVVMGEEAEKNQADYEEMYNEEKQKLDNALTKENEKYTKEVGEVIEKFTKVLDKAIENDVHNEKKVVATKVNALTFAHRKNKKSLITTFNNKLSKELREKELPKTLEDEKEKELAELDKEYRETFDEEFETNQMVIKQFKTTEHLTTEEAAPASSTDSEGGDESDN